jgi:hypothetical protein
MADIAAVFHWGPDIMDRMPVDELLGWQRLAVARFTAMNGNGRG